ncbi:MAG: hypothetical protein ACREP1_00640, partial [Rhodanobacteraceae bacterium]
MPFRKRLLYLAIILLVAALLIAVLSPFAVPYGLRLWLAWAGRQDGMIVTAEKMKAPFLRPVTMDELRIQPGKGGAAIELRASRITLDLNFRGWIFTRHTRLLHSVVVERVRGGIHSGPIVPGGKLDWRDLQRLLPDYFRFGKIDLDVVTRVATFTFRGASLSASDVESGRFFAHQISVRSPLLRQSFVDLRGATSWEENRLTIAGISLAPGLDLESLTIDLSSLTRRRLGLDFNLDTFGGTLRASFHGSGEGKKFLVDLAGSAANISLAQISRGAGLLEPLTGSLRASKFTFRGIPGEFLDATASIWIDARDFAWRKRRADRVVFGATYYGRRLQVEQLYVQQHQNELTVNGELLWPKKPIPWSALHFRGEVNATLPDADSFAQLFGAAPGDFSGALSAKGELDSIDPEAQGHLSLRGEEVRFRGVSLDSLGANLQLNGTEATLENLEVRHGNDFARAHGTGNLKSPYPYSARLTGAINDLSAYAPLLPKSWRSAPIAGGLTFDWSGDGNFAASSVTMQLYAHGLRLPLAPFRSPVDLTLEGTYSPQDIFFRTFKLGNDRASLGAFVMLGSNFIELQALALNLDGKTRATGTIFLPLSVDRWRKTGDLFAAFDERQKFDVDLALDRLDVAKFASALGEKLPFTGQLEGKLAAYGPLASLQLTTDWHLRNLGPSSVGNTFDFDLHYDDERADASLRSTLGISAPLVVQASLPLRLNRRTLRAGAIVDPTQPFSVEVDCPGLFLETLPKKWQLLGAKSGLLSGQIGFSGSWRAPKIEGGAQ